MNFLSMKYFLAVEKTRNITKAADHLHITQQTLSAHIASIEKEVGCALFIRHTPLELTYAGTVFLSYAKQFERLNRLMDKEFTDIRSEEKGVLHIGIAHTRGRVIMPDLIDRYQKAYPKMQIIITEATNDILRRKLTDGELDLIIATFPEDDPEIESRSLYEEEVVLLVSRSLLDRLYGDRAASLVEAVQQRHDLSPLFECPFLLVSPEDIAGKIANQLITEASFVPRVGTQSSNIETLLELCLKGAGACFCPEVLTKRAVPRQALAALQIIRFGDLAKYQIKLGWLKQRYTWRGIVNFLDIAANVKCENWRS
ncbi:LysR family transcriptional regulator [Deltaproteobacteria bacterium Smac51]|nr:LysR family transcriptional regulator [Deltaproteobacteria bacterium Smac51]